MNAQSLNASSTPVSGAASKEWLTPLELLLLGAIWGASFLFMRVAAQAFGAFALVEVRLALGALVLLPFLWRERAAFAPRLWPKLALIGAINSAIPFVLFAWAAQRAPAGIGAIANSMTVLFTTLVAYLLYGERIGKQQAIALLIGLVGVVVLASGKTQGSHVGLAVAAGTLASFLYGIGVNMVRRQLAGLPAAAVAAATLSCAALLTLPLAIAEWPRAIVPWQSWAAAIALGVVCTGFAFVLYYRLIQRIGGARAATVTYLVPLFGVVWAWLVMGEAVTPTMVIAAGMILGSVALSQRTRP